MLRGQLERVDHAQHLVEVAAGRHRVDEDELDGLVGRDHEDVAHRLVVGRRSVPRVALDIRGEHPVRLRHLEVGVGDDRVVGRVALRLLDVLHPALVVVHRVDREADHLDVAAVELRLDAGHVAELRRADRREVLRVREQHRPRVADPIVEADPSVRRVGLEVRCGVAELDAHVILLRWGLGFDPSASRYALRVGSRNGTGSDVQALVLEVEVALDAAHDVVVDVAVAPKLAHRLPLRFEELAAQPLVRDGLVLDRPVALRVEARSEPVAPEAVEPAQPLDGVGTHPVLVDQLVEASERRLRGSDPRLRLLLLGEPVVLEVEPADQRGQGQALDDEGPEDDCEGEEDDQVPVRERRIRVRRQRQRQRGGERDRAAHPRPREDESSLPGRLAVHSRHPRPVGADCHPREAHEHDDGGHECRVADQLQRRARFRQGVEDRRQLETDEREERRVQDEEDDLPDRLALEPRLRRRQLGRVPAHVDPDRDRRKHAGDVQRVRGEIREVPAEDRDRDLDRRVVEPAADLPDDEAGRQADEDSADDVEDEASRGRGEREAAGDDGDDRHAVDDQGGAVVHEALALDEGDQPPRKPQPLGDRGGGGRVGGGDDRTEYEGRGPGQLRDDGVGDDCDRDRRGQHETDGEERDRDSVGPELAQRGEEGGAVQERREERDEHEVGRELDRRHARHEAEREAAEDEEDRVRDPDDLRDREQRGAGDQEPQEDHAVFGAEVHGLISADRDGPAIQGQRERPARVGQSGTGCGLVVAAPRLHGRGGRSARGALVPARDRPADDGRAHDRAGTRSARPSVPASSTRASGGRLRAAGRARGRGRAGRCRHHVGARPVRRARGLADARGERPRRLARGRAVQPVAGPVGRPRGLAFGVMARGVRVPRLRRAGRHRPARGPGAGRDDPLLRPS